MSYYTSYSITIRGIDTDSIKKMRDLHQTMLQLNIFSKASLSEDWFVLSIDELKYSTDDITIWSGYAYDMKKLSSMYPQYVFKVSGQGEGYKDIWDHYFKNGEHEYCPWMPTKPTRIIWY